MTTQNLTAQPGAQPGTPSIPAGDAAPNPFASYYASADRTGDNAPWTVYREFYAAASDDEPIDSISHHPVVTCATQKGAWDVVEALYRNDVNAAPTRPGYKPLLG